MRAGDVISLLSILTIALLSGPDMAAQHTILWEIKDTTTGRTSYLLGTYHALGNHFVDSLPIIREKLLGSDLAIFESIDTQDRLSLIMSRPDDLRAVNRLKKDYAEHLIQMARDWKYPLRKMTLTEISWKLTQEYYKTHCGNQRETDEFGHFDRYLMSIAADARIEMHGLETDSLQVTMINQSQEAVRVKAIRKEIYYWIDANLELFADTSLCSLAYEYRSFDLDYQLQEPCPDDDQLISARNAAWMKQLPELLHQQNCFVAVGLLHLYLQCGLVSALRRQGYDVQPVSMEMPGSQ